MFPQVLFGLLNEFLWWWLAAIGEYLVKDVAAELLDANLVVSRLGWNCSAKSLATISQTATAR